MTLLAITSFAGEQPRMAPDLLPPPAAQVALDCEFSSGALRSSLGLGTKLIDAGNNSNGAFFLDDGNAFTWVGDFTAVKGPVIDDFYQRVYFADGSPYLKVTQQQFAVAGVAGWDAGTTYAAGAEVLYPMIVYPNWAIGATTYAQGTIVQYPANSRLLYRALKPNITGIQPNTDATAWELWGEGKRYKSLQNGNLAKTPSEEPTWWVRSAVSLNGVSTRAGVPAPADFTAKVYGSGTYQVNVVALDLTGVLSVYNVPSSIADARAAVDGSLTNAPNTNALLAVARDNWIDSVVLRATKDAANNTASAYFAAGSVKQQESVVDLSPIITARLYTFDPPEKATTINEYEVLYLWMEPNTGNNINLDNNNGSG